MAALSASPTAKEFAYCIYGYVVSDPMDKHRKRVYTNQPTCYREQLQEPLLLEQSLLFQDIPYLKGLYLAGPIRSFS